MAQKIELSAGERAYRQIRKKIISLEFKPNQSAGENQLADMLRMSRTPVREALTRLSGEGLIDFRSRAGTTVSPIRLDAVRSAQYVRETLELAIIADAVYVSNPRILFTIRQAIDEQEFAISEGDINLFFESDERMHRYFCQLVGRSAVWTVISDAKKHMDRVRRLSLKGINLNLLLEDHSQLLSAITEGNASDATNVMKTHLRRVMEDLDLLVEQYPDYFEISETQEAVPTTRSEAS